MKKKVAVAMLGKGATNHLHRSELVDLFRSKGMDITFIVRADYAEKLEKIDGCEYISVKLPERGGRLRSIFIYLSKHARNFYPSGDEGKAEQWKRAYYNASTFKGRALLRLLRFIARYKALMFLIGKMERMICRPVIFPGLTADGFDRILILGMGTWGAEFEGLLTWWAEDNKIPIIHFVGNYDNLSSKGFRNTDVRKLIVWGKSMKEDAIDFHSIPDEKIVEIGALRYNINNNKKLLPKDNFLESIGLNPEKKTILLAGFIYEYHYYEMIEVLDKLKSEGDDVQLILRLYPNAGFMESVYFRALIKLVDERDDVYISFGDPHYRMRNRGRDVIQIEEDELWNSLSSSDVVVNIYSTIALEACIFDKPVINMWYHQTVNGLWYLEPRMFEYPKLYHHKRMAEYGAIDVAKSRDEMCRQLRSAIREPELKKENRKLLLNSECGIIDGKASERLVQVFVEDFNE